MIGGEKRDIINNWTSTIIRDSLGPAWHSAVMAVVCQLKLEVKLANYLIDLTTRLRPVIDASFRDSCSHMCATSHKKASFHHFWSLC